MVRHWFSLTAVLAVVVLMVAADASQSRERRLLGRRARRNADGYVYSGPASNGGAYYYDSAGNLLPMPAEEGAVASSEMEGRRAFYPPENGRMRQRTVLLEVRVPPDAEIWIEGAKTTQKGAVRQFISPPLQSDRKFEYDIKAKWMENGNERELTKKVEVRPGRVVRVDLTKPSEEKQ